MFEGFFFADEGSEVSISGGVFGPSFLPSRGSAITLSGNEFRLDGELIAGLEAIDDTVVVEVTRGRQLDGILADGTPFAFSSNVGDFSEEVSVTLRAAVLPATGPSVIHVPSQPAPAVIRRGQTLTVEPGGDLGDSFRTGRGSIVNVNDGSIGFDFEAVDATVNVTGGSIGSSFTLFGGEANITGGSVAQSFRVLDGGTVNVSGGEVGVAGLFFNSLEAYSGSTVNVSGGVVGPRFLARDGSEVNISGGTVGDRFQALSFVEGQTVVNVSGGEFAGVVFANGAEFNLFGSEFRLDGVAIPGLVLDESFMVTDRDVPLTGILADGTPFSFDLTSTITFATDTFTPSTQLTVTLVDRVSIPGDFNLDGMLDVVDVDALVTQIAGGSNNVSFDLNGDNAVDRDDLTNWLSVAALRNGFQEAYLVGDSNLDGAVNSGDLNNLALNWRQDVALWSGGDFTASGQVNSSDLNALALHWQQAISSASAVRETVPEPSSWLLMVIGLFPIWHRKRRRSYG